MAVIVGNYVCSRTKKETLHQKEESSDDTTNTVVRVLADDID